MPNWFVYDTTNDRSKDWIVSSPIDPTYPVGVDEGAIKDPDISALLSIPLKYWKHSGGAVVEMSQAEKDAVDAVITAAIVLRQKEAAKDIIDTLQSQGRMIRAFAEIIIREINILRALGSLPDRTLNQLKSAIQAEIDAGTSDP